MEFVIIHFGRVHNFFSDCSLGLDWLTVKHSNLFDYDLYFLLQWLLSISIARNFLEIKCYRKLIACCLTLAIKVIGKGNLLTISGFHHYCTEYKEIELAWIFDTGLYVNWLKISDINRSYYLLMSSRCKRSCFWWD